MSAVVRRATRLSGTFAVLTGGSNDDLQRKDPRSSSCAAPRARKPSRCVLTAYRTGFAVVRSSENTVYLFSYFYFFRSLLIDRL